MKKIITAILGISTLALSGCANQTTAASNTSHAHTISDGYADTIAHLLLLSRY